MSGPTLRRAIHRSSPYVCFACLSKQLSPKQFQYAHFATSVKSLLDVDTVPGHEPTSPPKLTSNPRKRSRKTHGAASTSQAREGEERDLPKSNEESQELLSSLNALIEVHNPQSSGQAVGVATEDNAKSTAVVKSEKARTKKRLSQARRRARKAATKANRSAEGSTQSQDNSSDSTANSSIDLSCGAGNGEAHDSTKDEESKVSRQKPSGKPISRLRKPARRKTPVKSQRGSLKTKKARKTKGAIDEQDGSKEQSRQGRRGRKSGTTSRDGDGEKAEPTLGTNKVEGSKLAGSGLRRSDEPHQKGSVIPHRQLVDQQIVEAQSLMIEPINIDQPPVPTLSYGLERVLFNPGVYHLQDPRSGVFNFDPYLQSIMPAAEFNFDSLRPYYTASVDKSLTSIALSHGKKYAGSSSSMTGVLAHFHFLLSQWRPIETSALSQGFPDKLKSFTQMQRKPGAIFLRCKDGIHSMDADKENDSPNILSLLGKSMEKLLTLPTDKYERYRKSNLDQITVEERNTPESYHYCAAGDFLMRSQLDAHDPRLPGTGMFDLKTRAVVAIRMDTQNYTKGNGYQIKGRYGEWESYEREYFDMIRAAFLKYSLQVRMGRMDGIFVAFHNTDRIFGFQYISLPEMDSTIHGAWDTSVGDQEFRLSLDLLNKILDRATDNFPNKTLRIYFETRDTKTPFMYIFAEPMSDSKADEIQKSAGEKVDELELDLLGLRPDAPVETPPDDNSTLPEHEAMSNDAGWASLLDSTSQEPIAESVESSAHSNAEILEAGLSQPSSDEDSATESQAKEGVEVKAETTISGDDPPEGVKEDIGAGVAEDSGEAADGEWLDQVDKEQEEVVPQGEGQDLLAMTLTLRNKVNGAHVTRPENLVRSDRWAVEYSLTEITSASRAWQLYRACQARRRKGLDNEGHDEADAAASYYIRRLREMSTRGREWRKKQDERFSRESNVVLNGSASSPEPSERTGKHA